MNKIIENDCKNQLKSIKGESIDFIYIDPPYNTRKNTFEYNDSNDNWNEDIYDSILEARRVMKKSAFMFISIDDSKLAELIIICKNIFGEKNFLGMFITRQSTKSNAKFINIIHEYIICVCKDRTTAPQMGIRRIQNPIYAEDILNLMNYINNIYCEKGQEYATKQLRKELKKIDDEKFSWLKNYNNVDENGRIFFSTDLSVPGNPNTIRIHSQNRTLEKLANRRWQSEDYINSLYDRNLIVEKNGRPYKKNFLEDAVDRVQSVMNYYSRQGTKDLDKLGMGGFFSTAKPIEMLKYLLRISTIEEGVALDFFAGSGSLAQAVIEVNNEDRKNIEFILIQKKEQIKNNPKAVKQLKAMGYGDRIIDIIKYRLDLLKKKYKFKYKELE